MKKTGKINKHLAVMLLIALMLALTAPAIACTGLTVKTTDGSVVFARTQEFALELKSNLIYIPKGTQFNGSAPGGKPGMTWKSKYAILGPNALNINLLVEGMNDKGLYAGGFWFTDVKHFQKVTPKDYDKTISPAELTTWILSNNQTVGQVKANLKKIKVADVVFDEFGFVPPLHWMVVDADGNAIVIEYTDNDFKIYDNPLGVVTNSPPFDWHIKNLRNYVNLSAVNPPDMKIGEINIPKSGSGQGMRGLPGDYTPPSRFIRSVALVQSALPVKTAAEGVNLAWNIINNINIPLGAVRSKKKQGMTYERTQWTTVYDLKNHVLYFRTYHNQDIRKTSMDKLKTMDKNNKILTIPMWNIKPNYEDVTGQAK